MKLRDIVNRELVNLENCDQEPIHIPGSIQPHGCLIAVNTATGRIDFASSNTESFIGITHQTILGKDFASLFRFNAAGLSGETQPGAILLLKLNTDNKSFDAMRHSYGGYDIYEIENAEEHGENPDLLELSMEFVDYIENTSTITELCDKVAGGIRKITGYDRVMIYRFDENYNGEVIAESKAEELESFLGLHYPHTDIPVQARALYIKNQIRMIPDINYEPVPIYTPDTSASANLDLSYSQLRSVSPIHCQYLRNMGVGATLTISLLNKGKLWGLVACHHYAPKFLSYQVRMAAKLTGHLITSQIEPRKINQENQVFMLSSQVTEQLFNKLSGVTRESLYTLFSSPEILKVCNASGVALSFNNEIYLHGELPDERQIRNHIQYLELHAGKTVLSTSSLTGRYPELKDAVDYPGIIYMPLVKPGNAVMWYRRETVREVNWAGDPAKAIEKDRNGLSPRKSFASWKELVVGQSKPWLEAEVSAASHFVSMLQKHLTAILIAEEEDKQRSLAIALQQTNDELENVNWISTHDLQEPLRKIQMLASVMLDSTTPEDYKDTLDKVRKMSRFAERMQSLIRDIIKYTKVRNINESFQPVELVQIVKELEVEAKEHASGLVIHMPQTVSTIMGVPFLLRQLLMNLVTNSIRFSRPGTPPEITIDEVPYSDSPEVPEASNFIVIRYSDRGIGFEPEYNEHIFKIFSRLNTLKENHGTGIGLALCRKIMNTHKGFIKASGDPQKGASFFLYFPRTETA